MLGILVAESGIVRRLMRETLRQWVGDHCPRLAAALAFQTIFALAPLLVLVVATAGLFWGTGTARDAVVTQVEGLVGQAGADVFAQVLTSAHQPRAGLWAAGLAILAILVGATGFVGQLQGALNTIWGVERKPLKGLRRVTSLLRARLLSLALVLSIGVLLMISLALSAAATALLHAFTPAASANQTLAFFMLDVAFSTTLFGVLLACVFKVLPDAHIGWKDVWFGGFATSGLFTVGKLLMGAYLGRSSLTSTYGAAGSLAVLLAWVYYSSSILLFGAEFTQVRADLLGGRVVPKPHARFIPAQGPSTLSAPAAAVNTSSAVRAP